MNMLQERDKALCALPGTTRKSSHFFNSFFVSKLLEGDTYTYKNVKRWTKKFDIFSKEKVFFPVNISNTHWYGAPSVVLYSVLFAFRSKFFNSVDICDRTMMVAFMQKKKIVYYDSMGGSGHR
jgi:Ulp1 family protease